MTRAAPGLTIRLPDGTEIKSAEATVRSVERALRSWVFPDPPGRWLGQEGEAGWALTRLFGRMVELVFTRLNQVPDKNFLAFLNTAGVSLLPPRPARTEITFTPQKDGPPFIRVPAGTQAATVQTETQPEVVFETQRDVVVVPVRLVKCVSLDPVNASDNTGEATGESSSPTAGFAAFRGQTERQRILYLGDRELFGFPDEGSRKNATVSLTFAFAAPGDPVGDGWNVRWLHWDGTLWADLQGAGCVVDDGTGDFSHDGSVELSNLPELTESEVGGKADIWLACSLTGGSARASLPVIRSVRGSRTINATSSQIAKADAAFSAFQANTLFAPLDTAGEFFPLGPVPGHLDTFYLRCDEALSKMGATVVLTPANLRGLPGSAGSPELTSLELVWEYHGAGGWTELGRSRRSGSTASIAGFADTTNAFTVTSGRDVTPRVRFPVQADVGQTKVNNLEGYWVRARIVQGGYSVPASVDPDSTTGGFTFTPARTYPPLVRDLTVSYEGYGSRMEDHPVSSCLSLADEATRNHDPELAAGTPFSPFSATDPSTDRGSALYLGFHQAFPAGEWIQLLLDAAEEEDAPGDTPITWEYWNGARWIRLRASDGTRGLRRREYLGFFGPEDHQSSAEFGVLAFWLRARPEQVEAAQPEVVTPAGGAAATSSTGSAASQGDAQSTPSLRAVRLNTVPALNTLTVKEETLGSSIGEPGQTFRLRLRPVLSGAEIAVCEPDRPPAEELDQLEGELRQQDATAQAIASDGPAAPGQGVWVRWHEVSDFTDSTPSSRHFTLDPIGGELRFGDGRRGKIPPVGRDNIKARRYRTLDGAKGNVKRGSITAIRNPSGDLANVKSARNVEAAAGGSQAESVGLVRERGPQSLRHRQRAVTREDFVWLAREATGEVAQARCLPTRNRLGLPEPGWVTVVIMPESSDPRPTPSPALLREVRTYLEEHALANLKEVRHVHLKGPEYIEVTVLAQVAPREPEKADQVELAILKRLETFLHPLQGGPEGRGWELGRNVYLSEIYAEIEGVEGVDHVRGLRVLVSMQQYRLRLLADPETGYRTAPFTVTAGSPVSTFDERIKLLLAESLLEKEPLRSIVVSGFKVGDSVNLVAADGSSLGAKLTIASLDQGTVGFEQPFLLSDQAEALLSADGRVRLPLAPELLAGAAGTEVTEVTVQGFVPGDRVSIVSGGERHPSLEFLPVAAVERCEDRIHVPEGHLVFSGSHDIDMVLD
ncbi:MAG TPA: putative baseplate assembly protein [Candidatus Methylomirabilis sp.]|nr:putative baseplate assembly protein [Candidatus Methylomirabilis sp.]